MKIGCEIIRDLLFLYEEDGCSKESRKLVEEHLKGCKECRSYQKKMRFPEEIMAEKLESDSKKEEKVIKNSFRKVRRRWIASLVAVLLIFPMIGVGKMAYNEHMGEGICFSNLDEIVDAKRLLTLVQEGKYEKAGQMMQAEYEFAYQSIVSSLEYNRENADKKRTVEDWTACTLNGETWRLYSNITEYFSGTTELNESEKWKAAIYSGVWGLLIPEEIWNEVINENDISIWHDHNIEMIQLNDYEQQYEPVLEGGFGYSRRFCRIETEYGNYYVNFPTVERLQMGTIKSEEVFYQSTVMMPERIMKVSLEKVNEINKQITQSTEEIYGNVREMTEDEFCAFMQEKLVRQLKEYAESGSSFGKIHYRSTQWEGNRWSVCFDVTETRRDVKVEAYGVIVDIYNGEITGIRSYGGPDYKIGQTNVIVGAMDAIYWDGPY